MVQEIRPTGFTFRCRYKNESLYTLRVYRACTGLKKVYEENCGHDLLQGTSQTLYPRHAQIATYVRPRFPYRVSRSMTTSARLCVSGAAKMTRRCSLWTRRGPCAWRSLYSRSMPPTNVELSCRRALSHFSVPVLSGIALMLFSISDVFLNLPNEDVRGSSRSSFILVVEIMNAV